MNAYKHKETNCPGATTWRRISIEEYYFDWELRSLQSGYYLGSNLYFFVAIL